MGKRSVIIYITVAILLLFLVSQSPKNPKQHRHRNRSRRLKLRSNFNFTSPTLNSHHGHHIPFDPIVADLEMKREDREWEKMYVENQHPELIQNHTSAHHGDGASGEESQPEWEDFMNDEDYLNDEDKFNITDRLVLLFPKIDVNPADGFVSEAELTHWNLEQSQKEILHRTQREMEVHDKNKDGFVSFSEYEPPSWVKQSGNAGLVFFCILVCLYIFSWMRTDWKLVFAIRGGKEWMKLKNVETWYNIEFGGDAKLHNKYKLLLFMAIVSMLL